MKLPFTLKKRHKDMANDRECKTEHKTICEFSGFSKLREIKANELDVCKWETFNGWEVKKVYADYPPHGEPYREIIVVFVREGE